MSLGPWKGVGVRGELLIAFSVTTLTAPLRGKPSLWLWFSHTCDDYVAFIVESTWKDFISVSLEDLQALASLHVPDSGCFVRAASQKTVPLWVERNLQRERKKGKQSQVCVMVLKRSSSAKRGHNYTSVTWPAWYLFLNKAVFSCRKNIEHENRNQDGEI